MTENVFLTDFKNQLVDKFKNIDLNSEINIFKETLDRNLMDYIEFLDNKLNIKISYYSIDFIVFVNDLLSASRSSVLYYIGNVSLILYNGLLTGSPINPIINEFIDLNKQKVNNNKDKIKMNSNIYFFQNGQIIDGLVVVLGSKELESEKLMTTTSLAENLFFLKNTFLNKIDNSEDFQNNINQFIEKMVSLYKRNDNQYVENVSSITIGYFPKS